MAEQVLQGPEQPQPGVSEAPTLLSDTMANEVRPGQTFEDRALRQIRGTGPHVRSGGKVDRMIGTAGRMNQLTHGTARPEATSGEAQRQQLMGARAARQDPYRDTLHYRKDFGTAMSDTVHGKAVSQQKAFQKHIADTNKQLNEYSQQVAADKSRVQNEYNKGVTQIDQSYQSELSKLPSHKDLSSEYSTWLQKENHPVWVMSGSSPSNPGEEEGMYRLHPDQLKPFFDQLVHKAGMPVYKNRIYVGGRGQEVHDQLRTTQQRNKVEYYEKAAPQIRDFNAQVDRAKNNLATQRNAALSQLQTQLSDANVQLAQSEGAIQGRREGLQKEIQANQNDLKQVRQNYQARLGRVDEALSAMVGRSAGSRSEGEVRQINPRMVGQQ